MDIWRPLAKEPGLSKGMIWLLALLFSLAVWALLIGTIAWVDAIL